MLQPTDPSMAAGPTAAQMQQYHQQMANGGATPALGFDPATCRGLYIGNLDPKVNDILLYEIFSTIGLIDTCKVIKDKNGLSAGYGFVDYVDHETAERALQHLNGRKIYSTEIKVNWAYAGGQRDDSATKDHFHIFVGDLSPEVDDKALYKAFSAFGSISDARVMWDQNTGRSRGYGFVAFRLRQDAERALNEMNGEWLGNRSIRCNWANQKVTGSSSGDSVNMNDYDSVFNQSSHNNTTVYIGNLPTDLTEAYVRSIFGEFGFIEEVRMQKDKGYAFVRFQTHDQATRAIIGTHGRPCGGNKTIKCAWGKERTNTGPTPGASAAYPSAMQGGYPAYPYAQAPYYQTGVYNQQYAAAYGSGAWPGAYPYAYPAAGATGAATTAAAGTAATPDVSAYNQQYGQYAQYAGYDPYGAAQGGY